MMKAGPMKKLWRYLPALPALMLSGCTVDLLQPRGPVAEMNRDVMVAEFVIMMLVVVPTCVATLYFAWKYRASNKEAEYLPTWDHSTAIEYVIWGVPAILIAFLGAISWWSTHAYDPYRPLQTDDNVKPLNVQVVSLDWKWLFIYPDLGIATINQLDVPTNTPLDFQITSDSVMTSFFIPRLGSMIYAMPGQQTQLHLIASAPGDYLGEASQFSGRGFSDMKFRTLAMDPAQFNDWVEKVKSGSENLDDTTYPKYAAPQEAAPVQYFAHVQPDLFDGIVAKYNNGMVVDKTTGKVMHMQSVLNAAPSDTGMKE
ncbi:MULTISPECIES: ubiquinol oxidase subunit II [Gluconobacter]|uniref:Ubiquinol oxidase subunit 2 n=2 Tax=Gluconobacter albidus TaxID=318683 RepID=A0A149TE41_9PROT|nr:MULTISPECIES: ubiquinol oxidase subunit II [Gluconobacter]AQS90214.1 cytochrome ubiquinol oxidase subunit II [Gluconobacter albidus]KXV37475.1 cytochrome O ubiquinol oxidase subunit II [Gluconobacter albidus]KXV45780.1 cytochrome O ubiquinol oxidase subunit II [Gluconobacter albidus]MBS1027445.1 ubiquinol oxidase subunit II [Gluconobacter albidus]MCP1272716.1 ubiquinol oxidase subunit II [Gluconobacter albidus]